MFNSDFERVLEHFHYSEVIFRKFRTSRHGKDIWEGVIVNFQIVFHY